MFGPSAVNSGSPMWMFAYSILAATRLTGSIYPTHNMVGQLGIAQCNNTKEVLQACWIATGTVAVFILVLAIFGPMIFT